MTCSDRPILQRRRIDVLERHGLAVDEQPAEALAPERRERLGDRVDQPGQLRLRRRRSPRRAFGRRRLLFVDVGRGRQRRRRDDRHVEADQEPRALAELAEPPGHHLGGLANHLAAAVAAEGPADPRVEQAQVVVDLGGRARPSTADCGCCSSGGWRSPGRCPRSNRRPASPSARGTAGRRPTATRRSAAALRRRSCRRRATTCPDPLTPVMTTSERVGSVRSTFFRLCVRAPRTTIWPRVSEVVGMVPTVGSSGNS